MITWITLSQATLVRLKDEAIYRRPSLGEGSFTRRAVAWETRRLTLLTSRKGNPSLGRCQPTSPAMILATR